MPMIDMPATPVSGAEVVIERRVGKAGNRGLSQVVLMIDMPATPASGAEVVIERRVGEAGNRGLSPNSGVGAGYVPGQRWTGAVGGTEVQGEKQCQ